MIVSRSLQTPIGNVIIQATEHGLCYVGFHPLYELCSGSNPHLETASRELNEYFGGSRTAFSVALDVKGTQFQRAVWHVLVQIPFGKTNSYGWVAEQLQNPKAVRAVGAANGRNPISFIVPCHRIIGANGTLTGYAGGLEAKQWLLEHEQHVLRSM